MVYSEPTELRQVYEATINVNQLCVRLLFNDTPSLLDVIDAIEIIFHTHDDVREGLKNILTTIQDDEPGFQAGDEIIFTENDVRTGSLVLQTRTLFEIV